MRVDVTSLIELGLLPDAAGAWPLAAWLDATHLPAGHRALRDLIAAPLDHVDEVRARQSLLVELVHVASAIPWIELQRLVAQVERYLSSNFVIVPDSSLDLALFALRHRDIVDSVTLSLRAVDTLLTLSEQILVRVRDLQADGRFVEVRSSIEAAVRHPHREALRRAVLRDKRMALVDGMVRGTEVTHTPSRATQNTTAVTMRAALRTLTGALAQLDAFCSLARASASLGGALPSVATRGGALLSFEGLRHPQLPDGQASDVALTASERVVFLTGPNMAGKSTLLRAIGIAVHCAHLGMATSARRACVPLHDQLLVSITARDNLRRGESLYLNEVRRVGRIVDAVDRGDAVLAICDEVFRGTNLADATEATSLLVNGLARAPVGTFIVASHLAEVARSHAASAGVACWCMDVSSNEGPQFTYRARRGISDARLGMFLLDAEGVGPTLRRMAGGRMEAG